MKKLLSILLAIATLISVVPVMAEDAVTTAAEKEVFYTDVFEGHPTYLIEDAFDGSGSNVPDEKARPSGWDIDYRGGTIIKEARGLGFYDISETEELSMGRRFLAHKDGKITFETAFNMMGAAKSGFKIQILGGGVTAAEFVTDGDNVCYMQPACKKVSVGKYVTGTDFIIKAILDVTTNKIVVYTQGKYIGEYAFTNSCAVLNEVLITTPKEGTLDVNVKFVNMYLNYLVNDRFLATPDGIVPDDWKVQALGTETAKVAVLNAESANDPKSFRIADLYKIDNAVVKKEFAAQTKQLVAELKFIIAPNSEKVVIALNSGNKKAIKVLADKNVFSTTSNKVLYEKFLDNLWYTLKFEADVEKQTADIYLNYRLIAENVPFENKVASIDSISVETGLKEIADVSFDDVMVYQDLPLPKDYVSPPKTVESDNVDIAMMMYSMWREGDHYGWDRINPYSDRQPYLGWYTEGSPEVADWETKWLLEHGFDYQVYPWCRDGGNLNNPVKDTTRNAALHGGFLSSEYGNQMKFAILYSFIQASTLGGMDDFKNNIVPFWVEYYFKHPNYMVVDNKPIMYNYTWSKLKNTLGSQELAEEAIKYVDEECKKLGFDGLMFIGDASNDTEFGNAVSGIYMYGWSDTSYSLEGMKVGLTAQLDDPTKNVVASVPMGWNKEPWVTGHTGDFATPEDIHEESQLVEDKFAEMEANGRKPSRQVIYTCWNEWGEGHFYCPSTAHGFGYLNAVRDVFTDAGYKTDEEVPTPRQRARLEALYAPTRETLKILNEANIAPTDENTYVLKGWYFDKPEDYAQWKMYQYVESIEQKDGELRGYTNGSDPRIANEDMAVPLENAAGIRISCWADGAGYVMFYYRTDKDTTYGKGKAFNIPITPGKVTTTYMGIPQDKSLWKDTMTGLFFDPGDRLYPNFNEFGVKSIEILAWKEKPVTYYLNGRKMNDIKPPKEVNGTVYMSAYRMLELIDADTHWEGAEDTFTIRKDDKEIIIKDGSNIAKINGVDTDMGAKAFHDDGHFWVPMYYICNQLGATVTQEEPVKSGGEYSWEFNDDGDIEGFGTSNIGLKLVKNGALLIKGTTTDPVLRTPDLKLDAEKYKYVKFRVKNMGAATTANVYFKTDAENAWSADKRIDIPVPEGSEFVEYVANVGALDKWKGTITQIRVDPISLPATAYVDYIRVTAEP